MYVQGIETVKQIKPEFIFFDSFLNVMVGGRDDTKIGFDRFGITDPGDHFFFGGAKYLCLQIEWHVGNFVQK
ncbi:hypothetical protein SDC9_180845 [bioreactor metagenome]|uniref:Uncharacterized protein n=1 Tax=bioreactor metagenome TaxID=1076179 RepID=A0A645H5L8_9ZZZZ